MNEEREIEMNKAIGNMLSNLETQIKEPLNEEQTRTIFKNIHLCLVHLAENKANKL